MILSEIIAFAREGSLDDAQQPYICSNALLVQYAKMAQVDAVERGYLLVKNPNSTSATAEDLSTGTTTATTASKLVNSGAAFNSTYLNKTVYNTTDNTFATVTVVDSATQLSLSADIMTTGEAYVIGDASKALTRLCVVAGQSLYLLSSKVLKIKDCWLNSSNIPLQQKTTGWIENNYSQTWRALEGTPLYYIEENGGITLIPKPASNLNADTGKDTILMSVYHLPLIDLSLQLDNAPEIPEEYHFDLVDGICALAYQKKNSEIYDPNKAAWHEANFTRRFGSKLSGKGKSVIRELASDFTLTQPTMGS